MKGLNKAGSVLCARCGQRVTGKYLYHDPRTNRLLDEKCMEEERKEQMADIEWEPIGLLGIGPWDDD